MLNLSDKELDRLSKEAAQEYEPGDVLGPDSWEKLNIRLDGDLGKVSPNPLRHIRRYPFYYAPALLVLLGISYFYLTKHPPSSPTLAKNPATDQIQKITTHPANSTPAAPSSATPSAPDANGATSGAANAPASTLPGATNTPAPTVHDASNVPAPTVPGANPPAPTATVTSSGNALASHADARSFHPHTRSSHHDDPSSFASQHSSVTHPLSNPGAPAPAADNPSSNRPAPAAQQAHELVRSKIGSLTATKTPADISDSALRAFTLKSMPPPPIHRALHINRNWQFGIIAAPDFASVNSLAGDKPGSTLGLTVDYQFAPRWYIGSGLLLDRRNYAASRQDFHPPASYYASIGLSNVNRVDFIKGSFQMLEIPLNLRYDFSVTGNTLFFVTAGLSSFLLAKDYGNCYVNTFNHEMPWAFKNPATGNYLFSAMNFSVGVETGLSNSMSLLIAPYMKMPIGGMGFGQVQMSSVGITFGLKWAPVTSRRRR